MPREDQLTKEEAIRYLEGMKLLVNQSRSWEEAKSRLAEVGRMVGYKPAFRCIVLDKSPEDSVMWK